MKPLIKLEYSEEVPDSLKQLIHKVFSETFKITGDNILESQISINSNKKEMKEIQKGLKEKKLKWL